MSHVLRPQSEPQRHVVPRPWQFSLDTMLLLTTLIAVLLGITLVLPAMGSVLTILSVAALYRTRAACRLRRCETDRMSASEKIAAFFGSMGLIVTALCAGFMTLVTIVVAGWMIIGSVIAMIGGSGPVSNVLDSFSFGSFALIGFFGAGAGVYITTFILRETKPC